MTFLRHQPQCHTHKAHHAAVVPIERLHGLDANRFEDTESGLVGIVAQRFQMWLQQCFGDVREFCVAQHTVGRIFHNTRRFHY